MIAELDAREGGKVWSQRHRGEYTTVECGEAAADLREWTGSGPEGIILEFRGSKPWVLTIQSPEDLKAVRSALWNIGSSSRPMGTLPFHEDVLEFGTRIQFAAFVAHTQVISYLFRIY